MKQLSTVKWSTKSESVLNLLLLRQFGCPSNIRDFTSAQVLGVEDGKAEVVISRRRFGQNHQKVRKLLLAWQCGDAFSYILAFEQTERWSSGLDMEWTNHFRYKAFKKPVLLWLIRFSNIHCMFRRKVQGEIQVKLAKPINQHRDINVRSIKSGTFELARFFHFQNMNILKWLTLEARDNSWYFFLPVEYGLIYSRDYFVRFISVEELQRLCRVVHALFQL